MRRTRDIGRAKRGTRAAAILQAVAGVAIVASLAPASVAEAAEPERAAAPVRLRGYGPGAVSVSFEPDSARFICDDAGTAARLYAKLLRDLAGLSALPPAVSSVETTRGRATVFAFASGRAATVGLADGGRTVCAIGADTPQALTAALRGEGSAADSALAAALSGLTFPPPETYPPFLDFFDLRALKFYKRPMDSLLGYGIESHWPFAAKFGIGGMVSHGIAFADTKARGVFSYQPWDFAVDAAARAGSMLVLCPHFAGAMPLWAYNEDPRQCARPQTHVLVSEWIPGVEGAPYDNDGTGLSEENSPALAFEKETVERYRDHPGLGGWQFYCGKPIGDQLGMGMSGLLWDSSEAGLRAQRQWLRARHGLEELSRRWTGDGAAYRSWDDVPALQLVDIAGGDWDPDRLDLFPLDWQWAKAPERRTWRGAAGWTEDESVETGTPPPPETRWLAAPMPPSHRCNYLESGRCWYRATLPAGDWIAAAREKPLWLRLVAYLGDAAHFHVWVNGRKAGSAPLPTCGMAGVEIQPGSFRGDGTDEIIIEMPGGRCNGRIAGPVTLSPNPPQNFPYADPRANARWVDAIAFQTDRIEERNRRVFLAGRALDPDRPISISGADTRILSDLAPMCGEHGISMQSTSTDGFYWPLLPDMGRLRGFRFIGEPSQDVADEERFDRNFGTIFYTGASATAVFMDIEQYMKFEERTGGMSARRDIMRLVGKFLVDEPRTALYASTETALLQTGTEYRWNLARGEMQAAHHDATMATERELRDGLVTPADHPLLIDCGADVMTEEMVRSVEAYVRAGGTFVAFCETGRHTPTERDAHPLARLSCFRTADPAPGGDARVRFLAGAAARAAFPDWAGREFPANGSGSWNESNAAWNRRLERVADDAEIIAVYEPSGAPAAGVRRVGRGRVVTLASGFWREARDIRGKWMPSARNELAEQFFAQLGAERAADASSFRVWTRKATTKDGLEDWLVAFNVACDGATGAPEGVRSSLAMRVAERPVRVCDAFTGEEIPGWTWDGDAHLVRIPETEFGPSKTRIFAAVRPVGVGDALRTWWFDKTRYGARGRDLPEPRAAAGRDAATVAFDAWEFSADGGATWRRAENRTWKLQFPDLADYAGEAIYRTRFRLPEAAPQGASWILRFGVDAVRDRAQFLVNGRELLAFDRDAVHPELSGDQAADATPLLRAGGAENELEVRVSGGRHLTAGLCDLVWLQAEAPLADTLDLCDGAPWEAVAGDLLDARPATLPGVARARCLRRTFRAPQSWAGKTVFVEIEQPRNVVASVVIDGVGRNAGGGLQPFSTRQRLNVTELVKPGREQTLELWPRRTIPVDWKGKAWNWPVEADIAVSAVRIGVQ